MFNFFKEKLQKIHTAVASQLKSLFARETFDEAAMHELERILIAADTGAATSKAIIASLKKTLPHDAKGDESKKVLAHQLITLLTPHNTYDPQAPIHVLVGINGSGKTTFAGKLANRYAKEGKKVLLVAADTFRAAAPAQLQAWAQRTNTSVFMGKPGQDPASLVFEACELFKQGTYDKLIIDTAGRLQTKINLMKELEKINRSIAKQLPNLKIQTLLTVDAMLGQNSFDQAKLFHEATPLSGIVLTKMDGTGKGGIVFAICQLLQIPIAYISCGEQLDDVQLFDAKNYVQALLEN
jgi:fused signal recognition particle receptor